MTQKPLATSTARPACSSAMRIVPFVVPMLDSPPHESAAILAPSRVHVCTKRPSNRIPRYSTANHVVDGRDVRLADLDIHRFQDRHQRLAERLEIRLRVENID